MAESDWINICHFCVNIEVKCKSLVICRSRSVLPVKNRATWDSKKVIWSFGLSLGSYFPGHAALQSTDIILFVFLQVSGWTSAGVPQERPASRHLLQTVALARPAVSPRAARCGAVRVCLPHQERRGVRQPLSLPARGDSRYVKTAGDEGKEKKSTNKSI